jgi:hypothetical protein
LFFKYAVNLHAKAKNKAVKRICLFVNFMLIACFVKAQQKLDSNFKTVAAPLQDSGLHRLPIRLVPPNLQAKKMAFFCKKEWLLEQKTGLPIKFRLGSFDYTNWLEQKPNAVKQ